MKKQKVMDYGTRRCPYCAEEILKAAIFCKHCARRVRGRYRRLIVTMVIVAILASFYLSHKRRIDFTVRSVVNETVYVCVAIKDIIKELPYSLKAIRDYPEKVRMEYEILEQMYKKGSQNNTGESSESGAEMMK